VQFERYPMNITRRRAAAILVFTLMVLALFACDSGASPNAQGYITTPQPAYSAAQATLGYGQSQIRDINNQATAVAAQFADAAAQATLAYGESQMTYLNNQATAVGLDMAQAAAAAAQSTLDFNKRRMMDLSFQSTEVSQNLANAAATQKFIRKQTPISLNATATAQSSAATATYSVYIFNVTQTAQIQAYFDKQTTQDALVLANQRAYALTATPMAAIQASNVRTQDRANQRAFWDDFIVTPLNLVLSTLVILLLVVGCVLAYRRLMPILELRLRTISRGYGGRPLVLLDGIIRDPDSSRRRFIPSGLGHANLSRFARGGTAQVEIIGPFDPSVAGWIAEAEQKLRGQGGDTL
jgi:hypothetical protein